MVCVEEGPARSASGGVICLSLPQKKDGEVFRVLCLGAHSDDIEIGCGGAILRLREQVPSVEFHWIVFSAAGLREQEAQRSAELFVGSKNLGGLMIKRFRDGFMPFEGASVKEFFEELKHQVSPDLIFTHNRKDAHQDHRLISELTTNTFRDHLILEYEIPKYDGDMGRPSLFVPLAAPYYEKKVGHLMEAFQSQRTKRWFQPETFFALMRLRGMECNAPSGYAEAFYCRKLTL
jgi:LmbE family N-acetylglucosaminyl deacetylase